MNVGVAFHLGHVNNTKVYSKSSVTALLEYFSINSFTIKAAMVAMSRRSLTALVLSLH